MMKALQAFGLLVLVIALWLLCGSAHADEVQATMQNWLEATKAQGTIPPGTVITMQNWQQFKQYMPARDDRVFRGQLFLENAVRCADAGRVRP